MNQTLPDRPSENTPPRSPPPMQVLGERRIAEETPTLTAIASGPKTAATPPNIATEYVHRAAWKAGVLGAFNAMALVLAARIAVLVAIGGGIALTWLALSNPDPYRLGALAIYSLSVVVPTIWLAGR